MSNEQMNNYLGTETENYTTGDATIYVFNYIGAEHELDDDYAGEELPYGLVCEGKIHAVFQQDNDIAILFEAKELPGKVFFMYSAGGGLFKLGFKSELYAYAEDIDEAMKIMNKVSEKVYDASAKGGYRLFKELLAKLPTEGALV